MEIECLKLSNLFDSFVSFNKYKINSNEIQEVQHDIFKYPHEGLMFSCLRLPNNSNYK